MGMYARAWPAGMPALPVMVLVPFWGTALTMVRGSPFGSESLRRTLMMLVRPSLKTLTKSFTATGGRVGGGVAIRIGTGAEEVMRPALSVARAKSEQAWTGGLRQVVA